MCVLLVGPLVCVANRPTDENVEWDWGSHELVNYGDTKDVTAS